MVVARRNPDLAPFPYTTLFRSSIKLAAPELLPERLVLGALAVGELDEHRMVLSPDFLERVAECLQEILVGMKDGAIEGELDHGLRLADRGDFSFVVGINAFLVCNVGCKFDDLARLAPFIRNRVIKRLNPPLSAPFPYSTLFRSIKLAAPELLPERLVLGALAVGGLDEHGMVFSPD